MKLEELMDEIIIGLGGGLVDVELSEAEIKLAIKRAIRQFQQKGHNTYRKDYVGVTVNPSSKTYPVDPMISDVIRIIKPTLGASFTSEDLFVVKAMDEILPRGINAGCGSGGAEMVQYDLALSNIDMMNRYAVSDVDFKYDRFKHEIVFFQKPKMEELWFLECYMNLDDEEYMDILWVQQWSLAEAKQMLGYAYRKFSSVSAPTGETQLAGDSMINEARDEMERLLVDIENQTDGDSASGFWAVYLG